MTSIIMMKRGKPGGVEAKPEIEAPGESPHPLKEAAMDLLHAIEHKSVIDIAHALQAAYDMCESSGDEMSEHESQ